LDFDPPVTAFHSCGKIACRRESTFIAMMRLFRASLVLVPLLALSGCGYIHFGRLPETAATLGDDSLAVAYSNLGTEHKMLQQELLLARKEGAALRAALENRSIDGAASSDLVNRLNETSRELATLRASYAKLQTARTDQAVAAPADPALQAKLSGLEEKLAASLRDYTQLQEENARLRGEVDTTRAENTTLAVQVKTITSQNEQAQAALAQLNTELLAQKDARARAEQQTAAAHAQLAAVVAQSSAAVPTLAGARESSAESAATLRIAKAPPSDAPATAELRTNPERLRAASEAIRAPAPATAEAPAPRIHVVKAGETLESIAKKYYSTPERWRLLYAANNAILSGGRPLKPGMELEIPPN
jgi:nucleoid-associated protein YgaU